MLSFTDVRKGNVKAIQHFRFDLSWTLRQTLWNVMSVQWQVDRAGEGFNIWRCKATQKLPPRKHRLNDTNSLKLLQKKQLCFVGFFFKYGLAETSLHAVAICVSSETLPAWVFQKGQWRNVPKPQIGPMFPLWNAVVSLFLEIRLIPYSGYPLGFVKSVNISPFFLHSRMLGPRVKRKQKAAVSLSVVAEIRPLPMWRLQKEKTKKQP